MEFLSLVPAGMEEKAEQLAQSMADIEEEQNALMELFKFADRLDKTKK